MTRSLLKIITPFYSALMVMITTSCVYNQQLRSNDPEHLTRPALVLHAKGAYKEDQSPLKQFETLKSDELLTLMDGYVLLQHYSGRLYEYEGDTTLVAAVAVQHTQKDKQTVPTKLDFLFSDFPYKNDQRIPDRANRYTPRYTYLYPFDRSIAINRDEPLCLWWKPQYFESSDEVKVAFKNGYDDELSSFHTYHQRFEVRIPDHITDDLLIIDLGSGALYAPEIGVNVKEQQPEVTPCNATESIELLYIATRLEQNEHYQEAYEFYERAAKASSQPIYEVLKLNALQRLF